ncbi:MAG: hypothetical protein ACK50Q_18555, partial [Labrys sp. (in: a-proteobacteria)]
MTNPYFNYDTAALTRRTLARAEIINAQFALIAEAFDKVPAAATIDAGLSDFTTDAGVANAYVVTKGGATAYQTGMRVRMRANQTNTGPSTLNWNGIGVKPILSYSGFPLSGGEIVSGGIAALDYDGTAFRIVTGATTTIDASQLVAVAGGVDGAAVIPSGTDAQRPPGAVAGYLRWNDTSTRLEVHNGVGWAALPTSLSQLADTAIGALSTNQLLKWNGTAWAPGTVSSAEVVGLTAQIAAAVASLVNSAPATLDTLSELAAALGNDANFAATVNAAIANRLPLSGGTLTGELSAPTITATNDGAGNAPIWFKDANGKRRWLLFRQGSDGRLVINRLDANENYQSSPLYIDDDTGYVTIGSRLEVGDANFYTAASGSFPQINFDAGGDSFFYDRAANEYGFNIANGRRATINTTGFVGDGSQLTGLSVVNYQVFTTPGAGTWTKPAGATANDIVYVELIGGGSSGGRGNPGGGGGAFTFGRIRAGRLGATESVSVGGGGAAEGAGVGSPGNSGGASTFGAWFTANGGVGAVGGSAPSGALGQFGFSGASGGSNAVGGNAHYGGGGGGGGANAGGTSVHAGGGGAGSAVFANPATAGTAPGGGGGGNSGFSSPIFGVTGAGGRGGRR